MKGVGVAVALAGASTKIGSDGFTDTERACEKRDGSAHDKGTRAISNNKKSLVLDILVENSKISKFLFRLLWGSCRGRG